MNHKNAISPGWCLYVIAVIVGGVLFMDWFISYNFYLWAITYPIQLAVIVVVPFVTRWAVAKLAIKYLERK